MLNLIKLLFVCNFPAWKLHCCIIFLVLHLPAKCEANFCRAGLLHGVFVALTFYLKLIFSCCYLLQIENNFRILNDVIFSLKLLIFWQRLSLVSTIFKAVHVTAVEVLPCEVIIHISNYYTK